MKNIIDGNAIVYCDGAFKSTYGKTAHGLVRFTHRYTVLSVIDSTCAGNDAGELLDGRPSNIPIVENLQFAIDNANNRSIKPKYFVLGLAPDGGTLSVNAKNCIKEAMALGLNIDSGLHDFLSEDNELMELSLVHNVKIRDIRKPPPRKDLHFFSRNIETVTSLKLAILGTDSAIGKRTTAWLIVNGLNDSGIRAQMIGTGQTAWLQGAKYSLVLDSLVNDFVSGEIEHAIVSAYQNEHPDVIIIEGQGSLMNPAYPGGFEILAAGRPEFVILQHAPKRLEYDGFPGYPLHSLKDQINAIHSISKSKVLAITINHEGMSNDEIDAECIKIKNELHIPAFDVLKNGARPLIQLISEKTNK